MTFDIIAYPWPLFKQCYDKNVLGDCEAELKDKLNDMDLPAFSDAVGNSCIYYNEVCDEISMAEDLSFEGKGSFMEFCSALLQEALPSDLDAGAQDEITAAVVDPERLDRLAGLTPKFSVQAWKDAYRKFLIEDGADAAELEPIEEMAEYVSELCKFVSSVAGQGNCLAVQIC